MSRNREYTRRQRRRVIKKKQKVSLILFQNNYYRHLGQFNKGRVLIWRDARSRFEEQPDLREIKSKLKMCEQLEEYEVDFSNSVAWRKDLK